MVIVAKTPGADGGLEPLSLDHLLLLHLCRYRDPCRIWPISSLPQGASKDEAPPAGRNKLQTAPDAEIAQLHRAPPLWAVLRENSVDAIKMAAAILPRIMAVGLLGLLAAKYTPLFDVLGLVRYPFT